VTTLKELLAKQGVLFRTIGYPMNQDDRFGCPPTMREETRTTNGIHILAIDRL
jgi:hypothetical protein